MAAPDFADATADPAGEVTRWLRARQAADPDTDARIAPLVYDELHRMAERAMRHEPSGITLQPTALVHEAWMRLLQQRTTQYHDRAHFFAIAAQVMRRILVDQARRRAAGRRDAASLVSIDEIAEAASPDAAAEEVLQVHEALESLARVHHRQARVVELRYFVGLSIVETAEVMGVTDRTIKRDWTMARAWLHRALSGDA